MARRARNIISRTKDLSLRAAELMDDGLTDGAIAERLFLEFDQKVSARTVGSFRRRDYEPIADERLQRIDDAREVQLILDAARGSGASFAEAANDLLAKEFYDMVRGGDVETGDMIKVAKSLGKMRELEIQELKIQMLQDKELAAQRIKDAALDTSMTPEDLVNEVDKLMGIAR